MKNLRLLFVCAALGVLMLSGAGSISAQNKRAAAAKPIVFAVLNDGKQLEPIAHVSNKKLSAPVEGSAEPGIISAFNKRYYRPGASYRLVFAGGDSGSVSVKSSDASADCSKNLAVAVTKASRTPLKGLVMGLATNLPLTAKPGTRRRPTNSEREEIETLVRAEYAKEKLTPKELRYQNLTMLDVNSDGEMEFVGSYWIEIDKLTRGLLFFIGEMKQGEKPAIGFREYRSIDQDGVMGGEIKVIDEGIYHELLLDSLDYDADGTNEIFTYTQSFEGAGYQVYRRAKGKWSRAYEFSNYRCAF